MKRLGVALLLLVVPWTGPLFAAEDAPVRPASEAQDAAPPTPPHDLPLHRDPFRPFTKDIHPEVAVQLTPLQHYEIGQLTVVATIWAVSPPRAMLEDGVGMGYIITLGTPVGRNGGVVTAIEPARVVVEERVLDFYGKEQVNRIVMETPKEEGPNKLVRERK